MDFKEINGTKHYLYSKEEFFSKYHYLKSDNIKNWRDGNQGDWVFTDDYDVCTILKKGSLKDKSGKSRSYVRTVWFLPYKLKKRYGWRDSREYLCIFW